MNRLERERRRLTLSVTWLSVTWLEELALDWGLIVTGGEEALKDCGEPEFIDTRHLPAKNSCGLEDELILTRAGAYGAEETKEGAIDGSWCCPL